MQCSQHVLVEEEGKYRCVLCQQCVARHRNTLVEFIKTECREIVKNRSQFFHVGYPVRVGTKISHSSHKINGYRGVFFCTQCGNISAQRMIGLVRPCTGVLSQYGRNNIIALEKGDLPPKVAEWPGASIPINLPLSLEEQNALTHIQGLIRNYQVEALPESEDSSSGFLSDGTSHDVGVPSASASDSD